MALAVLDEVAVIDPAVLVCLPHLPGFGQRDNSLSLGARHAKPRLWQDAMSRSWTAAAKMNHKSATRSRGVPGERTWDRSLTQACTCEGSHGIEPHETDLGAVNVLADQEATHVAVVGRWGRVATHWLAYAPL